MRKTAVIWMVTGLAIACVGAGAALAHMGRLHFGAAGFSIKPLEPARAGRSYEAMAMYLPPSAGFAPNVNVLIQQPFKGSITDYIAISKRGTRQRGFKVIGFKKTSERTATFEYSGQTHGRTLRFYGRAILSGNKVYLATAAASEGQWKQDKAKLEACVDSLVVDKGPR